MSGNGDGNGYYGNGNGYGYGYGYYGDGYGYGGGNGDGNGYYGNGYGNGNGYGYGYYGDGYGYGGGGNGDGGGDGRYGYSSGYGDGEPRDEGELRAYLAAAAPGARFALALRNAESRRMAVEMLGADRFFRELNGAVVHEDIDGRGNRRRLVRVPMADTTAGYLQAVHVVCPTTGREYYLGVPPDVATCQQAVASTFGLTAEEYQPWRES